MGNDLEISTLFLDIGGVLLTNGWDRHARAEAVKQFNLELEEVDERHHLTFGMYEEGRLSLNDYLDRVIFFKARSFSREDFRQFMFARSQPLHDMLEFTRKIIRRHNLRGVAVSNEGKELTEYRIRKFDLGGFIETFISSCFVHTRKPDLEMYRIALDISQARPEQVLYIDDREMFVEVAATLDIRGIHHTAFASTREKMAAMGLDLD